MSASSAEEKHWLERLQERETHREDYGLAVYYHPALLKETQLGTVRARHMRHLSGAGRGRGPLFHLQIMKWPSQLQYDDVALERRVAALQVLADDELSESEDDDMEDDIGNLEGDPLVNLDRGRRPKWYEMIESEARLPHQYDYWLGGLDHRDADSDLRRIFAELRADFKRFSSQPKVAWSTKWQHVDSGYYDGLLAGVLDDCFIVFDIYSAFTWWDTFSSERAWAWIVDADYEETDTSAEAPNGVTEQYRGYLRVALTEIADNFCEARLLQQPQITLQMLWSAANETMAKAFVSVH